MAVDKHTEAKAATMEPSALYPTTTLLVQQLAILSSILLDSLSSASFSLLSRLLGSPPSPPPPPPARSVVVVTGTGTGLARDLALRLAANGSHVFVQAPGQMELSGVVLSWQRLKSRLSQAEASSRKEKVKQVLKGEALVGEEKEGAGTLIPLVFSSLDPHARAEAVKTVRAYVREHSLAQIHLVNTIDPSRARASSSSPSSSTLSTTPSAVGSTSPSSEDRPPSAPLHRRSSSAGSASALSTASLLSNDTWRELPLPLAISTDSYVLDLHRSAILGTVSLIQDFLPLLRSTPHPFKGRVVNVWAGAEGGAGWPGWGGGPVGVALDGYRSLTRCLGEELDGLGVKVSLVLPGSISLAGAEAGGGREGAVATKGRKGSNAAQEGPVGKGKRRGSRGAHPAMVMPTVSVTNDVRSILTVASDPSVRAHFDTLLRLHVHLTSLIPPFSDPPLVFRTVRAALNDRYPRSIYPVGLDTYVARWVEESVPENVRALVGRVVRAWGVRSEARARS